MAFSLFKARANPIAVDVGTDSIKVLQVEPQGDVLHLSAAACAEIPEAVRRDRRERDTFVADTLKKILKEHHFRGAQVVTCLPASHMAMLHLRVGRMNAEELAKALPFEAQGKLPFDPQRAVIRHIVAGEVYHDGEARQEVILLAAAQENVARHLEIFSRIKLDVVGIHVEPTALIECFSHLSRRKGDDDISTMYLDLGCGSTHVVIAHGKSLVFAKHVGVGGDVFTRRVAELTKLPYEQARDLRLALGRQNQTSKLPAGVVALDGDGAEQPLNHIAQNHLPQTEQEPIEKARQALEEPIEQLLSELELCIRYYESCFPGKHIDRTIFVGGESRNVQLCQRIARQLALPATLGDPLARLLKDQRSDTNVDLRVPQPGWAIAVGLGAQAGARQAGSRAEARTAEPAEVSA